MLNEKVKHIALGEGIVIDFNEGKKVSVRFDNSEESKTFKYPDAFEKFLKFVNPEMQQKALDDLQKKNEEEREAKEKAREEFEKNFEENLKEKLILEKDSRRQSRKKSTSKK